MKRRLAWPMDHMPEQGKRTAIAHQGPRRRRARALDARSDALVERMKELTCLHSISTMLKTRHTELGQILQEVVDVLPSACRFPDLACACITLKSRQYRTQGFRAGEHRLRVDIVSRGEPIGVLEVDYRGDPADGRDRDFLPEEERLFTMVANRLAEIVALKEAESRLSTYEEHLSSLAVELTMAEERERRALAVNLHDRIGQGLAVAKLKLETLKYLLPPEHHARLEDVTALVKEIVNDTRSLTFDISPPILYELGLEPALSWLGEHVTRQFGLPVEVHRSGPEGIDVAEGLRIVLFRSIQELLMNAVKHAHASRATVRLLLHEPGEVRAIVEDDGVGFDVRGRSSHPSAASGFGLFSIRERIGHLRGTVVIESRAGHGTRIQLSVPGARVKAGPEERA